MRNAGLEEAQDNLARNMPRVHPETSLIVQGMVETPIHEARI